MTTTGSPAIDGERGYPVQRRGVAEHPGLYILGLHLMWSRHAAVDGQLDHGSPVARKSHRRLREMTWEDAMEFLRKVDFDRLAATSERVSQTLIGHDSGASSCSVNCIKTPPGEGSPAGLHKHLVDQLFYILSGTMSLEIEGKRYEAGPGTLAVFPAGIPHRNWNGGTEPTVHLAINAPLPDPAVPFTQPMS